MKQTGLVLKDVVGDGSCLFRSIADQVDGDESLHRIYRDEACRHMLRHADFYTLFIDEDEEGSLDQYLKEMLKDG
jgi:OTU domain-containing protein 3